MYSCFLWMFVYSCSSAALQSINGTVWSLSPPAWVWHHN